MTEKKMQFLYGDRELLLASDGLLEADVDVLVLPADRNLEAIGPGRQVHDKAGEQLARECRQLITEYGEFDKGMAVQTGAGNLERAGILHAVLPVDTEEDPQHQLEKSVACCLQLCELNSWRSVAFPGFQGQHPGLSVEMCAESLYRSITHFWDARFECSLEKIQLCPGSDDLQVFFDAFRNAGISSETPVTEQKGGDTDEAVGYVTLDEQELDSGAGEVDEWFCR